MTMPPPNTGPSPTGPSHRGTGRPPAPGDPLPVAALVRQSYALLGRHRDDLLRLGVVPVLIAFVIDAIALGTLTGAPVQETGTPTEAGSETAAAVAPDPALFLFLLGVVPMTLFAVGWLRVLLLGPAAAPGLGLRWGRRETRFLLLGIWISLLAGLAVIFPLGALFAFLGSSAALLPFALGAAMLGYLYILLRLSLALTAVAIDESGGFSESWAATQGVSGRFLLIVVLTALPFQLAALLLPVLLAAVGLYDAAPFASLLAGVALGYLVSAAALAAIALAYRRLRGARLLTTT
jgi:hypothetical protein